MSVPAQAVYTPSLARRWLGPEIPYAATGIFSPELSALRGVACMVVLIFHCLVMFPTDGWGYHEIVQHGLFDADTWKRWVVKFLFFLFNGSAAVIFFFVLSGTVMGMSFTFRREQPFRSVWHFYARRLLRIVPCMWLSVTAGFIYVATIQPFTIFPHAASGVNEWYKQPATLWNLTQGLLSYKSYFNPVNWSLYIEFIGSFVFPLYVLLLRFRNTAAALVFVLACLFTLRPEWYAYSNIYVTNFALGLSVLQWGPRYGRWLSALPGAARGGVLLGCFIAIGAARQGFHEQYPHALVNLCESLGAAGIIAYVLFAERPVALLKNAKFLFIGKISYSLYLSHFIFMHATAYFIALHIPPAFALEWGLLLNIALMIITIPPAILIGKWMYDYVESQSLRLSKRLHG